MTNEQKELLEALKQGDVFYKVTKDNIQKFEYLMLYPFHNPDNIKIDGYHIVLDKNIDEPKRMYYKELATILLSGTKTYEEAKKLRIKMVEEYLEYLKRKENETTTNTH